jgi:hypothetical protein
MEAELLDATHIGIKRHTLPRNQPESFGNVVCAWSGTDIGWHNQPVPIAAEPVHGNTPDGDMVITLGIGAKPPFMVAYGTSNNTTAYCAAQIAGVTPAPQPLTIQLLTPAVFSDSLLARFALLPGNAPKTYANWVGLWLGAGLTYDATNRIARVAIDSDQAYSQAINDLSLLINTTYTLGYACGPRDQDLAASFTFTTGPFLAALRPSRHQVERSNTPKEQDHVLLKR